ncbi:MAG: class I SAM-dependent methyltransferase [Candidatus Zixiibacteriota bacterium]
MPKSKSITDAYGREIYDYYNGDRKAYELVERDDGYIDLSTGPSVYFAEFKNWSANEKQAIKFARGRVLDLGCGAGRVLLHLKSKGLDAAGLDTSPLALDVCRKRGLTNLYQRSITKMGKDMGQFDTFVMFGNNFGLFGSFKRARWLLKKMYNLSSDNARIIATTCDPGNTTFEPHLQYHKLNRKRGRMIGQIRLRIRYRGYKSSWFDYLLVSEKEMRDILKSTGWELKKVFDVNAPIYSVVIEKAK